MNTINVDKDIDLSKITLSFDETRHTYNGEPLYGHKFEKIMSFHPPGVAAVKDQTGAYHINLEGNAIYENRFYQTFGYYDECNKNEKTHKPY